MHQFMQQASSQTLAQGMAEYGAAYPPATGSHAMSAEAREFFRCHDVVHVVYGCGHPLNDETVVKIASMLGTTAGLGVLRGYRLHESIAIYRQLKVVDVIRAFVQAVVTVPRTALRCLQQHKRWPWDRFDAYRETPLCALRLEFGIRVAHTPRRDRPTP